jgi:hypothetical protein
MWGSLVRTVKALGEEEERNVSDVPVAVVAHWRPQVEIGGSRSRGVAIAPLVRTRGRGQGSLEG